VSGIRYSQRAIIIHVVNYLKSFTSNYPFLDIPCPAIYTLVSINDNWRHVMQTAKIFINGRSQAVRLPKDLRFSGKDIFIKKIGKIVVLLPKDDPWSSLVHSLDQFTDDFMDSRDQPIQDSREKL
jgi:antitoxin VapB